MTVLPATAGAESTPGVTSTSITIGATVPLTGPAAPGYDEIAPAMDAVFAYVNAHGGVDGRKIHYTYLDDGYNPANTATLTRKLVLQDNIFADVGSLGTPTQSAVQSLPERAEGARSSSSSRAATAGATRSTPTASVGSRPTRSTARSSGSYIKANFAGKKIGYLYQDDEFGQDVVKGLDMEIPVVLGRLAADLRRSDAGRSPVQPDGGAEGGRCPGRGAGHHPGRHGAGDAACRRHRATSPSTSSTASGADPPTVGPLLSSFAQKGGASAAQVSAAAGLLNGVITNAYFAPESDTSNPWVQVEKKILESTRRRSGPSPGSTATPSTASPWPTPSSRRSQKAGKNLTRQASMNRPSPTTARAS